VSEQIQNKTARGRLKARQKAYYTRVATGVSLGYRKGSGRTDGRWRVRVYLGDKRYVKQSLGQADDHSPADGKSVLSFDQALDMARSVAKGVVDDERDTLRPISVSDAMNDYLDVQRQRAKSAKTTETIYKAHILPKLGRRTIGALTTPMIRRWHSELATAPARIRGKDKTRPYDVNDREAVRKRKATANRILTVLKAGLNHAFREGCVADDTAWRRVPPFDNVDAARVRFLTVREAQRLVNSSAPDLKLLVRGALLTGGRYGELIALRVDDFDMTAGTVYVRDSKGGKPRHIPLNDEGLRFFEEVTAGRSFDEAIFKRANGHPWGKSHQARPMKEAVAKAKLKDVSFHILRHTYGNFLAAAGVPLQVIASVLGHADTRTTEKHYAHLQPDHVAMAVRANLPTLSTEKGNVRQLA
jgi:integrase